MQLRIICRDGEVLMVTEIEPAQTPLNGPKPLAKLNSSKKPCRLKVSCLCHPPTHLVLFLITQHFAVYRNTWSCMPLAETYEQRDPCFTPLCFRSTRSSDAGGQSSD